jgi:deoxyribodipyrimidine photo-lyase
MKRSLIWFKTDLRLHDNETLVHAIEQSDEIIPVYCLAKMDFRISEFGFQKTGNFRGKFLLESLNDLDKNLRQLGSGLLVVSGDPEIELANIAEFYKAQKVFSKKEVAYEEKRTEERVEKALWKKHCTLETFSTSTLYHAEDLPFSIRDIPDIFTGFRKKAEKDSSVRSIFSKPDFIKSPEIKTMILPALANLCLADPRADPRAVIDFKGGETEAMKRVTHYFFETKSVSNYKETRNALVGKNNSSKFSAWLALGCLSPREIYYELKKYETQFGENDSTYWLVFELMWRDYFRFMMKKHRHKFFLQAGIKDDLPDTPHVDPQKLKTWIDGETGVDFIDANMLELKHTGFMSNRGRQNVASYFCNDLKLDWRFGAAYFEQQLIDYDVCSNWGNWAYLAGVGNDPRGNRYFNIEKQAAEYDKNEIYRKLWLTDSN